MTKYFNDEDFVMMQQLDNYLNIVQHVHEHVGATVVCGLDVVCGLAVVEAVVEDSVIDPNKSVIDRQYIVGSIVYKNIAVALYLNRLDLLFKHGSFVPADVR